MAGMGTDFRNRLRDSARTEAAKPGTECQDCGDVLSEAELFDGFCEHCSLEQRAEGPMDDWSFVRDFRL